MAKSIINVGVINNPNSGDNLRAGGIKINSNTNEIYNTFGRDSILHATGVFRALEESEFEWNESESAYVYNANNGDKVLLDAGLIAESNYSVVFLPSMSLQIGDEVHITSNFASNTVLVAFDDGEGFQSFEHPATGDVQKFRYTYIGDAWRQDSIFGADDSTITPYIQLTDDDINSGTLTIDASLGDKFYYVSMIGTTIDNINIINDTDKTIVVALYNNSGNNINFPYNTVQDVKWLHDSTPADLISISNYAMFTSQHTPFGRFVTFTVPWEGTSG